MANQFYDQNSPSLEFLKRLFFGDLPQGAMLAETTKLREPGSAPAPTPTSVRGPVPDGTFQFPDLSNLFSPGYDPTTGQFEGSPGQVMEQVGQALSESFLQAGALPEPEPLPSPGIMAGPSTGGSRSGTRPQSLIAYESPGLVSALARLRNRPNYHEPGIPEEAFGNMRAAVEAMRPQDPGSLNFWERLTAAGLGIGQARLQGADPHWAGLLGVADAQNARDSGYAAAVDRYLNAKIKSETEIAKITDQYNREILETEQQVIEEDAANARKYVDILKPTTSIAGNYLVSSIVDPESGRVTFHKSGPIDGVLNDYRQSQAAKNWMDVLNGGEGRGRSGERDRLPEYVQMAQDFQRAVAESDPSAPGTLRAMIAGKALLEVLTNPFSPRVKAAREMALDEDGPMAQLFGNEAQFHSAMMGSGAKNAKKISDEAVAMAMTIMELKRLEAGGNTAVEE